MITIARRLAILVPLLAGCAEDAAPEESRADTGAPDATALDTAPPDTNAADTSTGIDAALDTVPPLDAGDALDAGDGGDAAVTKNVLYGAIEGFLIRIDPETGASTEIGPTTATRLAWNDTAKVVRVLSTNLTSPTVGTLDLCTGVVTAGPRLKYGDAGVVAKAEGFACHPTTGACFLGIDANGDPPTTYLSETSAALDVTTGTVTPLAKVTSLQNDIDVMTFYRDRLFMMDILAPSNNAFYEIDTTLGTATKVSDTSVDVRRFTYDPSRDVLFGVNFVTHHLVRIDATNGAITDVGEIYPSTKYVGSAFGVDGFAAAPAAVCP